MPFEEQLRGLEKVIKAGKVRGGCWAGAAAGLLLLLRLGWGCCYAAATAVLPLWCMVGSCGSVGSCCC